MSDTLVPALMLEFARSTGLTGAAPPRRYLWTDAFAVCNFLGLYRQTRDREYLDLAKALVAQVHHVLGRHRADDSRHGWISGLSEQEGELHPTSGGLRIGKEQNERPPDQPIDQREEWDRDGQYFHYLTKWMHALHRIGSETGEVHYRRWAAELAVTAQRAFTRQAPAGSPNRMSWKMSIDLSRSLVPSMGQHDPLDGLVTCLELQSRPGLDEKNNVDLQSAIEKLAEMCEQGNWVTDDPLGIGGLLDDAARVAQMVFTRGVKQRELLRHILISAEASLRFSSASLSGGSAERRLAFRELGLSIGLHGLEWIESLVTGDHELTTIVNVLLESRPIAGRIEEFWCDPHHRRSRTWLEHCDINTVMLATSLAPEGFLQI